ncbi:MAG: efflux RND transporter periplasmic adaptor subunit [Phycisphaerales bacterium]
MSKVTASLADLSRGERGVSVPRPPARWGTRVVLPAAILLAAAGLIAYSARDALLPADAVWIAPAVMKQVAASGQAGERPGAAAIVQGPGLVEPSPYAVTIPALEEGVVKEVLVLEGDQVRAGQVVATLVAEGAVLEVDRAKAELEAKRLMAMRAKAQLASASARVEQATTELNRMTTLLDAGGATPGEVAQARAELSVMQRESEAMDAEVRAVEGELGPAAVMLREAELKLGRMTITAPCDGIVMSRAIEPGMRISMGPGSDPKESGVMRLYDPSHLQVVVDVPLADAAAVEVGQSAEVSTEALAGRHFDGRVARVVHEANTARNTVQFKIELEAPDRVLKPGMLMRVKIKTTRTVPAGSEPVAQTENEGESMVVPKLAVRGEGESAWVWVVTGDGRATSAERRTVTLRGDDEEGYVVVTAGLRPGERVIVDAPASLTDGKRVKVLGERLPGGGE